MCAGTVVEPPVPASAASVSVTSRSRSVAFSDNFALSARTSTLPRIGMVLRRSTTRCTWPSDFRSCARSTVTFIAISARSLRWKSRAAGRRAAALKTRKARSILDLTKPPRGPQGGAEGPQIQGKDVLFSAFCSGFAALPGLAGEGGTALFLQLALQRFDLFGQRRVPGNQCLDLAHGVQHRGVVASAEPPAN